jgi:hypothetical protein
MELIKKYNYEDPLHIKGDPFGAADAKVAHLNQLITEVDNQSTSITDLTDRVETLENAPKEYYITGYFILDEDAIFRTSVVKHNTHITNLDDSLTLYVPNQSSSKCKLIFGFSNEYEVGSFVLSDTQSGNLAVNGYEMSSFNIVPTKEVVDLFKDAPFNAPLVDVVNSPDYLGDDYTINTAVIAEINCRSFVGGSIGYTTIPTAEFISENIRFFKFEIRFSEISLV